MLFFFFPPPSAFLLSAAAISNISSSLPHLLLTTTHAIFIQAAFILPKSSPFHSTTALGALCLLPQEVFFLHNATFFPPRLLLHLQALVPIHSWKHFRFTRWNKTQKSMQWAHVPSCCSLTCLVPSPCSTPLTRHISKSVCSLLPSSPLF